MHDSLHQVAYGLSTGRRGQQIIAAQLAEEQTSTEEFHRSLETCEHTRVAAPGVFLTTDPTRVPDSLVRNIKHNRVLHQPTVLLTFVSEDRPWVPLDDRLEVTSLGHGVHRVVAHYGVKQQPHVLNVFDQCRQLDLKLSVSDTTFFLGRVTLDVSKQASLPRWRTQLYLWIARTSDDVAHYFCLRLNKS